jgi:phosphatidylinositol 3-kinase
VKKHESGDMPKSEWLDKLVFRRMTEIHAVRARMPFMLCSWLSMVKEETEKSNSLYLYIDLPRFDFPVIFSELVEFLLYIPVVVVA